MSLNLGSKRKHLLHQKNLFDSSENSDDGPPRKKQKTNFRPPITLNFSGTDSDSADEEDNDLSKSNNFPNSRNEETAEFKQSSNHTDLAQINQTQNENETESNHQIQTRQSPQPLYVLLVLHIIYQYVVQIA